MSEDEVVLPAVAVLAEGIENDPRHAVKQASELAWSVLRRRQSTAVALALMDPLHARQNAKETPPKASPSSRWIAVAIHTLRGRDEQAAQLLPALIASASPSTVKSAYRALRDRQTPLTTHQLAVFCLDHLDSSSKHYDGHLHNIGWSCIGVEDWANGARALAVVAALWERQPRHPWSVCYTAIGLAICEGDVHAAAGALEGLVQAVGPSHERVQRACEYLSGRFSAPTDRVLLGLHE